METSSERRPCDPGWYHVAWAFLKLVGGHSNPNTYKKCRLQLYQYPRKKRQQWISPQTVEEGAGIKVVLVLYYYLIIMVYFGIDLSYMEFFAKNSIS